MIVQKITSLQNNLVKLALKLQMPKFRKQSGLILIDGEKTIQGLIASDVEFEYLFALDEKQITGSKVKNLIVVNNEIIKKISTTKTPVDIVGIIKEKRYLQNDFFSLNRIALIDGIKDPGNLGTIIRSAVAFSIQGIILFGDCVDIYNSKTIRATAQNMFKIPILHTDDIEFISKLKKDKKLISTVVNSRNDIFDYRFDDKFIIAFGSEAKGMGKEILSLSDEKLTLFMDNNVESINLGICSSIVFSLIKMQKRQK